MNLSPETIERCRSFIGRTRDTTDSMSPEPLAKLATLLGRNAGNKVPLCWHWAYFNPAVPPANAGQDGHERLGLFMPDVPLPRRMWAAGEIEILTPLRIGVAAKRISTIEDVVFKQGQTGDLCFVTVRHEITQDMLSVVERQSIVYREAGRPEKALRHPNDPVPDGHQIFTDTTLQAYSSITQNGHRIHWDRDFCRNVENYPDLLVHGPLLATLLATALHPSPDKCLFRFRAHAPVFVTSPFRVEAQTNQASLVRSDGVAAMTAQVT